MSSSMQSSLRNEHNNQPKKIIMKKGKFAAWKSNSEDGNLLNAILKDPKNSGLTALQICTTFATFQKYRAEAFGQNVQQIWQKLGMEYMCRVTCKYLQLIFPFAISDEGQKFLVHCTCTRYAIHTQPVPSFFWSLVQL